MGDAADTRLLVNDMARRAVIAWVDKLDPDELDHRMLMGKNFGDSLGENVKRILEEMARVH